MPRCQVEIIRELPCGDEIGRLGFTCVVCGISACNQHSGDDERELSACANCMRQCVQCEAVKPANDGMDGDRAFLCAACIAREPILRVELAWSPLTQLPEYLIALGASAREVAELHLGPLEVAELMPPLVPVFTEELENVT